MKRLLILIICLAFAVPAYGGTKVIYFRAQLETIVNRLQGPKAMPRLDVLLSQSICVSEDDGNGVPVWSVVIKDEWEEKARSYVNKFLGVGMQEVWDKHQDVARTILMKRIRLVDVDEKGDVVVVTMPMSQPTPVDAVVLETGIPPHTFAGYNVETGLSN